MKGIGAAKQATEYMVTVPYVDPTEAIHVAIDGSNDGKLSTTSKLHTMRPLIASIPERRLLRSLSR